MMPLKSSSCHTVPVTAVVPNRPKPAFRAVSSRPTEKSKLTVASWAPSAAVALPVAVTTYWPWVAPEGCTGAPSPSALAVVGAASTMRPFRVALVKVVTVPSASVVSAAPWAV